MKPTIVCTLILLSASGVIAMPLEPSPGPEVQELPTSACGAYSIPLLDTCQPDLIVCQWGHDCIEIVFTPCTSQTQQNCTPLPCSWVCQFAIDCADSLATQASRACTSVVPQRPCEDTVDCDIPPNCEVNTAASVQVCGIDPCELAFCTDDCIRQAVTDALAALKQGSEVESICGLSREALCGMVDDWGLGQLVPGSVNLDVLQGILSGGGLILGSCVESCTPSGGDGQYQNLDCHCNTAPPTLLDLDGDLSLNEHDADDDCDLLADDLENHVSWLNPAVPNENMNIVPPAETPEFRIAIHQVEWLTGDVALLGEANQGGGPGSKSTPDPYLDLNFGLGGTGSVGSPLAFGPDGTMPGFSKASHPWNVAKDFTWDAHTLHGDWASNLATVPISEDQRRFDNFRWEDRDADGIPVITLHGLLMEDDTGSADRGANDAIGMPLEHGPNLLQAGVPLDAGFVPNLYEWYVFGGNHALASLEVQLAGNWSKCAVHWASLIWNGDQEVALQEVRGSC